MKDGVRMMMMGMRELRRMRPALTRYEQLPAFLEGR